MTLKGEVKFEGDKDIDSMGQVVHVEVLDPDLKVKECYSCNVVFSGKQFVVKLPVSYSERPGRYSVVLEHAITGTKAETSFDVVGE